MEDSAPVSSTRPGHAVDERFAGGGFVQAMLPMMMFSPLVQRGAREWTTSFPPDSPLPK